MARNKRRANALAPARLRSTASAAALALAAGLVLPQAVHAQETSTPSLVESTVTDQIVGDNPDAQLLLEADQLIYDFDEEVVTAAGNVQIYYEGTTIEADQVRYDQATARVLAFGRVKVVQPDGNIIYAEQVELTDDLRDGFIESLVVLGSDETRFVAASAERRDGDVTIFQDGAYTACPSCENDPDKPPTWQVRAKRIIYNQREKVVQYEDAVFEFLGVPIAYVPVFFHADPTAGRRSGLLRPTLIFSEELGFGASIPYYFNLAPNYDLTVTGTGLTNQGFLGEAEFRHRLERGSYIVRGAAIHQLDPEAFATPTINDDEPGNREFRGALQTAGLFRINEFWTWGFEGNLVTDRTFLRTYELTDDRELKSELFLTGLSTRNYFDLRGVFYQPLFRDELQEQQGVIHPSLDHNYVVGTPVLGGTVQIDTNLLSLTRADVDFDTISLNQGAGFCNDPDNVTTTDCVLRGFEGNVTRLTSEMTWRRTLVGPLGQLITPRLSARGDLYTVDVEDPFANYTGPGSAPDFNDFLETGSRDSGRGMVSAGFDWRWPFMNATSRGIHTIEPIVQVIARPDATDNDSLPNSDAQSFVFDDTNLFDWDKFSGYDLIEGGTRANVGIRYGFSSLSGFNVQALIGQSYQLAGENPFADGTGLEDDASDYVASLIVAPTVNFSTTTRLRLDEEDFSLERLEIDARHTTERTAATLAYVMRAAQPELGFGDDREEIGAAASLRLDDHWRVFGRGSFDLEEGEPIKAGLGISWADECFEITVAYDQSFVPDGDLVDGDQRITFNLKLRTLGETGFNFDTDGLSSE